MTRQMPHEPLPASVLFALLSFVDGFMESDPHDQVERPPPWAY